MVLSAAAAHELRPDRVFGAIVMARRRTKSAHLIRRGAPQTEKAVGKICLDGSDLPSDGP
jgi:hypothetical protein